MTLSDEAGLARDLADIADQIAMRFFFSRALEVSTKPDGTLVTTADREIERVLRTRIFESFPDHAVMGEEGGLRGEPSAPVWVIDPIDGTNNFAWGIPIFATLIGLRIDGRTELGVVSAPALGERYEAARGDGARFNGVSIHVSSVSTLPESRVCYASWAGWAKSGLADVWRSILTTCRRSRGFGDFWGHTLVARGAADVMAEPELAMWDVAALEVIVEEAGGRLTTFSGDRFGTSGTPLNAVRETCLTTNGLLHDQLVAALSAG